MDSNDLCFTAKSPLGYTVTLYEDTYYNHIISSDNGHNPHTEFTPPEVKASIENPIQISAGNQPNTHVYFAKSASQFPSLYLQTVVDVYPDNGDVRTAYLTKDTSHGVKEVIYLNVSNKL